MVLAGGTMEPMSEFIDQLFLMAGATSDRIMTFSCDHVVPKENIMSNVVTRGPTGVQFEFTFQNRQDTKLVSTSSLQHRIELQRSIFSRILILMSRCSWTN